MGGTGPTGCARVAAATGVAATVAMAPRGMADGVAAGAVAAPPVPAGGAPGWQALTTRTTTNAGMNRAPRTARSGFQVQESRHSGVQHLAMLGVSRQQV